MPNKTKKKIISDEPQKGFWLVKVGSDHRPATSQDIDDIRNQLKIEAEDMEFIVTHHAVTFEWIHNPNYQKIKEQS